ncbi:MAG: hypothetical protein P4L57_11095 [Rhizomicrobium sp.]|nr:hypothetical protein [Rhizomicrobium sp.]
MAQTIPSNTNIHATLREIVDSPKLSTEEKIKLLQERELDLREILVAAEEGMTKDDNRDDPGVALRQIHDALQALGCEPALTAAPTKAGG